ncbi:cytochrome C assembly family protein [Reinekea thalattae]|uniref:Phosphohydrolase n=1 Tax=Reinekea thalattae TaxID=2593301 RepID=A0A5C8Z777_9GAMM|nr:cytochrome c biogenesis protein CcsA [Reinekea thalattae]TXR53088.1 phosphohydrolase [Reinekea thalattae]
MILLLWIAILTYSACGITTIDSVWRANNRPKWQIYLPAYIGLAAHSAHILLTVHVDGLLQLSLLNSVSICIWLMISVILISSLTKPLHNLFTFLMPICALLLVIAAYIPQHAAPKLYSTGMLFHIFIALLSASIMTITTLQAALVDIQSSGLHKHHTSSRIMKALPPLLSMERLMFEWLIVGFCLLTIAIVTGATFIENIFAQHLIHKTVLTVIAWFFYGALIFGHLQLGWRGQRASRMIYTGSVFLVLAFIGSKFVLEYLLNIS